MKIVGFLQNQWWKNPDRIRRFVTDENRRRHLLVWGLSQCRSGKTLVKVFAPAIGAPAFKAIYWENVTKEFGSKSGCRFKADVGFVHTVIVEQRPKIVLCFGKVASDTVPDLRICEDLHVLCADHPAARRGTASLEKMAKDLKELLDA